MKELRCPNNILHGRLDGRVIEVTCRSARCGKESGITVLHQFDVVTGEFLGTRKFRTPNISTQEE